MDCFPTDHPGRCKFSMAQLMLMAAARRSQAVLDDSDWCPCGSFPDASTAGTSRATSTYEHRPSGPVDQDWHLRNCSQSCEVGARQCIFPSLLSQVQCLRFVFSFWLRYVGFLTYGMMLELGFYQARPMPIMHAKFKNRAECFAGGRCCVLIRPLCHCSCNPRLLR